MLTQHISNGIRAIETSRSEKTEAEKRLNNAKQALVKVDDLKIQQHRLTQFKVQVTQLESARVNWRSKEKISQESQAKLDTQLRVQAKLSFDWVQKHAQLAYEILKRDVSTLIPTNHQRMGSAWIHGLEVSEHLVRQPLTHTAGHTLIVGTTGAGKTRAFDVLVNQAVLRGEAVIIIDPKGDKDLMVSAKRACQLAHALIALCISIPLFRKTVSAWIPYIILTGLRRLPVGLPPFRPAKLPRILSKPLAKNRWIT